jgi:hypothetical protein
MKKSARKLDRIVEFFLNDKTSDCLWRDRQGSFFVAKATNDIITEPARPVSPIAAMEWFTRMASKHGENYWGSMAPVIKAFLKAHRNGHSIPIITLPVSVNKDGVIDTGAMIEP